MMNFLSDEIRRDPYPMYEQVRNVSPVLYEQVRNVSPVLHDPQSGAWMVFDYESVKRVLNDQEAFSSSMFTAGRGNPEWLIFFDPPRHTKLRALIMRAFTPKVVANLEPRIRELSNQLLDQTSGRGEMDLAVEFAIPLPMMVIAEMIGISSADWPRFRQWSESILRLSYTISGGEQAAAASAEYFAVTAEMSGYVQQLIEQRRAAPMDDLLTKLVEAEVDGERLTEKEILGFVQVLLVAGNETTTNLINNAVLCFIENRDQLTRLRAEPALLPSAIEEVLRYRSPAQWMFRATRREVDLQGQMIPAGKLVLPVIGSANRDPKQFRDSSRFDITRDPNPHIAFGHGVHFCIGAPLSRLEARIALSALLERTQDLDLASQQPWEPRKALHVLGPARLPIRFEPNARAAAPS